MNSRASFLCISGRTTTQRSWRRASRPRLTTSMLPRPDRALASGFGLLLGMGIAISAEAPAPTAPLMLAAKIPLREIIGRIDHLAVDVRRQRLFAAELGNN